MSLRRCMFTLDEQGGCFVQLRRGGNTVQYRKGGKALWLGTKSGKHGKLGAIEEVGKAWEIKFHPKKIGSVNAETIGWGKHEMGEYKRGGEPAENWEKGCV